MRRKGALVQLIAMDGGWSAVACTCDGVCASVLICSTAESAADIVLGSAARTTGAMPAGARDRLLADGELTLGEPDAEARAHCVAAAAQLAEFARTHCALSTPLDVSAYPEFGRRVLLEVAKLRPGELATYGGIAARVGRPGGARAVGQVMATNPVAPFVPCHRVIGARGLLHGFGGGLPLKAAMLAAEGVRVDATSLRVQTS